MIQPPNLLARVSEPGAPPVETPQAPPSEIARPTPGAHHRSPARHGSLPALQSLLYLIAIAIFIITFVAQPFRIPSESMEPTLLVGDFLLVDKQAAAPSSGLHLFPPTTITRGEVVVFHYPVDPAMHLVKRVIGLPGDHVRLHRGHVFVNGVELREPYAVYRSRQADAYRDNFPRLQTADPDVDSRWWIRMRTLVEDGQLVIPPDSYFVLGDNRDNSDDSRYWGLVPRGSVVGQPIVVYFSLRSRSAASEAGLDGGLPAEHHSVSDALVNFARWDRVLHRIR